MAAADALALVEYDDDGIAKAFRADVLEGLAQDAQGGAGALALRRRRLGAVRGDHAAARILPDPRRDRDPAPALRRLPPADRAGPRGGRVRLGLARSRPRCCSTASSPRPTSRSTSRAISCAPRRPIWRRSSPACRSTRSRPTSCSRCACPRRSRRCPSSASSPARRSATWSRAPRSTCCARCALTLGGDAQLLIGMDLVKDVAVLEAAYDDAQGVTAEFNLNLARRINRELGGTIPLDKLRHVARWNDTYARIEMHLEALDDIDFEVSGRRFALAKGETIHTENSHKFDRRSQYTLLLAGGWTPVERWLDAERAVLADPRRGDPPAERPVSGWPRLDYAADKGTIETLHLLLQLIGKLPLRLHPWINHGWHVALRMTPRGAIDPQPARRRAAVHRRARLSRRRDPRRMRRGLAVGTAGRGQDDRGSASRAVRPAGEPRPAGAAARRAERNPRPDPVRRGRPPARMGCRRRGAAARRVPVRRRGLQRVPLALSRQVLAEPPVLGQLRPRGDALLGPRRAGPSRRRSAACPTA